MRFEKLLKVVWVTQWRGQNLAISKNTSDINTSFYEDSVHCQSTVSPLSHPGFLFFWSIKFIQWRIFQMALNFSKWGPQAHLPVLPFQSLLAGPVLYVADMHCTPIQNGSLRTGIVTLGSLHETETNHRTHGMKFHLNMQEVKLKL